MEFNDSRIFNVMSRLWYQLQFCSFWISIMLQFMYIGIWFYYNYYIHIYLFCILILYLYKVVVHPLELVDWDNRLCYLFCFLSILLLELLLNWMFFLIFELVAFRPVAKFNCVLIVCYSLYLIHMYWIQLIKVREVSTKARSVFSRRPESCLLHSKRCCMRYLSIHCYWPLMNQLEKLMLFSVVLTICKGLHYYFCLYCWLSSV